MATYQRLSPRTYSSVDEIVPPVDGANYRLNPGLAYAPAEPVWTYTAPTPGDFYAPYISGAQRLPNGNTLICDGVHGTLFESNAGRQNGLEVRQPDDRQRPFGGKASRCRRNN